MDSTFFTVVAVMAIVVQSYLLFLFFFEPRPPLQGLESTRSTLTRIFEHAASRCWTSAPIVRATLTS